MLAYTRVIFVVPSGDAQRIARVEQFLKLKLRDSFSAGFIRNVSRGSGEIVEIMRKSRKTHPVTSYEVRLVGEKELTEQFVRALFERGFISEGNTWRVLTFPDGP